MIDSVLEAWRNINVLMGFVGFVTVLLVGASRAKTLHEDFKVFLLGMAAFCFNLCYGSLEVLYWPEYWFRVPLATASVAWVIAGSALNFLRHSKESTS